MSCASDMSLAGTLDAFPKRVRVRRPAGKRVVRSVYNESGTLDENLFSNTGGYRSRAKSSGVFRGVSRVGFHPRARATFRGGTGGDPDKIVSGSRRFLPLAALGLVFATQAFGSGLGDSRSLFVTDPLSIHRQLEIRAATPGASELTPRDAGLEAPRAAAAEIPSIAARKAHGAVRNIAGGLLLVVGVGISLLAFGHDLNRLRILSEIPQGAASRIAPEVQFIAAALAGTGAGLTWTWGLAIAWVVGHLVAGYMLLPILLSALTRKSGD